ncbi:phosphonopyruvate decarboxylase [Actinophytocola sp. KF-1]
MAGAPAVRGAEFLDVLAEHGVRFLSGVPCSYFSAPLRLLEDHPTLRYVPAVNEGSALAMAAGARLAGVPGAVIAQNSGFGNLVNPLTSLVLPYRIPQLVIMSMRGWPAPEPGEQQHELMGKVVPSWLDSLAVPHWTLQRGGRPFAELVAEAAAVLEDRRTAFILVGKGAIEPAPARSAAPAGGRVLREDVVSVLVAELRDEFVLSTTGYLSRAMLAAGDRPGNFYMQGSMGHVAGLGLGAALQAPAQRIVVLDGDGSLLMHLGAMASVAACAPPNLVHIVFDNGAYESTGAQPAAARPDFAAVATALGYRSTATVSARAELRSAVRAALDATGPSLLVVAGAVGGSTGKRASESLGISEIAARFEQHLGGHAGPRR